MLPTRRRRQRRPARRARWRRRSPRCVLRGGAPSRAPLAAARAGAAAALLAGQRARRGLRRGGLRPARRTPPTTRRCSASCARSASATGAGPRADRGRADARPLGGALGGAARDARARLGAPARPLAQRALLRRSSALTRGALPRLAAARRRSPTSRCRDAALDYSAVRRGAPAERAAVSGTARYLREVWRSRALAAVRGAGPRRSRRRRRMLDAARHTTAFTLRAPRAGQLHRARALHALLGARAAATAASRARPATGRAARARAPARCASSIALLARRGCSTTAACAAGSTPSSRLAVDGRPRSSPAGARPAARLARRAAAGLAVRRCLHRLPARARARRGQRQRGVRARPRPDLARARAAPVRRAVDAGVGVGQPLRDGASRAGCTSTRRTSVTIGALLYLYLRHNRSFYFVRNMFMIAMAIALVGYIVFPTAPPRFMPEWGFIDSVADFTRRARRAATARRSARCSTPTPRCPRCTSRSR